jgi:hypothetical protein
MKALHLLLAAWITSSVLAETVKNREGSVRACKARV